MVAQIIHIENQSPYIAQLQNVATWAELMPARTDPSIIELFNQQQAIERDTNGLISKVSDFQSQYKNDDFLADLMW